MKKLSTKQEKRLEKKKKKIAALAEIMQLNPNNNDKYKENHDDIKKERKASKDEKITSEIKIKSELEITTSREEEAPKTKKIKLDNRVIKEYEYNVVADTDATPSTSEQIILTNDEYKNLKKELNAKKGKKHPPKIRLRELGDWAKLDADENQRIPIFLTDIQHLLMTVLIGNDSPCPPSRWCSLDKIHKISHSVVLIVEGISLFHYFSYQKQFVEVQKFFSEQLEILIPQFNETKILQELATIPLTHSQKDILIEKYGSLEAAIETNKDSTLMVKTVFSIKDDKVKMLDKKPDTEETDKFPRTKLLLSALQMVDEGYPMPLRGELAQKYKDYKFTKDAYEQVHEKSPIYGVDCEMCRTSAGENELTRISIVNEKFKTVYETLVRPSNRIVDYLTKYSGITPDIMMNVTKQLTEVQEEVQNLLPPDAILVGQSLNADLHAMKMMHPYVIDTSVIFNITGDRRRKTKLQILSKMFLDEVIQDKMDGHDSVEDSIAAIKLTKLKLSRSIDFGDVILDGKRQQNERKKQKQLEITQNLFACASKSEKNTAIITSQEIAGSVKKSIEGNLDSNITEAGGDNLQQDQLTMIKNSIKYYQMDGNKAAIKKTSEICLENSLSICNVNIAPQQLELSRIEKTITNIDKWIGNLHENLAFNGIFVVIFGGSPGSNSGVAMVKIKNTP